MPYIKDGVYPIHEHQIREAHPNTSFPHPMEAHHVADFGYGLVHETVSTYNPATEVATEGAPVFEVGQWNQTWVITSKWNSLADAKAALKQRVTEKRDQVQFGGADVGGVRIKTDPASIALLDQALMLSQRKPNGVLKVKSEAGVHMDMTAAAIGGIFDMLGERVARCWDAEAAHFASIDQLTLEGCATYDINTGWPL